MKSIEKSRNPFRKWLSLGLAVTYLLHLPLAAQDEAAAGPVTAPEEKAQGDALELTEAADRAMERGMQYLLKTQNPNGSWSNPDGNFHMAGILVPTETIDRVVTYLRDQVWNEESGGFGYQGNTGTTLSCTAGGAYAAQLCGMRDTEWVQASIRYLENSPKVFNPEEVGYYFYAHYYAIQAMVQAGEEHYTKWYPQIRDALLTLQQPDGSWMEGGKKTYPHPTPMAIIILGTPHRYIPVYQQ